MWKLSFVVLLISLVVRNVSSVCNECNSNGAACISKNTFHMCFGGVPDRSVIYTCPLATQSCSKLSQICLDLSDKPTQLPACGDTSKCGKCGSQDGSFACTSRTTFTACFGGAPSEMRGTCAQGELCYASLGSQGKYPCGKVCAPNADDICDIGEPNDNGSTIPTSPTFSPTPPTGQTTASPTPPATSADCSNRNATGRYPLPNDAQCVNYIYCFWRGGVLVGDTRQCPQGFYFNANINNCQNTKPAGCL